MLIIIYDYGKITRKKKHSNDPRDLRLMCACVHACACVCMCM